MRFSICPVCAEPIAPALVNIAEPFPCPNCDEQLRAIVRGRGAGWWVIMAFVIVVTFHLRLNWIQLFGVFLLVPILVGLLNVVLGEVFGYDLEPAGRIPLGGFDD